jgi:hypothetical protein
MHLATTLLAILTLVVCLGVINDRKGEVVDWASALALVVVAAATSILMLAAR